MKSICVIGEGAWGTAIASLLSSYGNPVKLWCHDHAVVKSIQATRCNTRYLSLIKLSSLITPTISLVEALDDVEWIFEAIPVKFLRSVVEQAQEHTNEHQRWVVLSKGIEKETLLVPTQIIQAVLSTVSVAVLSGPSFAHDVVAQQPTVVALSAQSELIAQSLKSLMDGAYFKTSIVDDMIGIQLCAALKNVIALAVGIAHGAGYADNTRALIITQGLEEIGRVIGACGGKQSTVYGLAGVGDLVLTACSDQSRNVRVGRLLGQGTPLDIILEQTGMIPEAINTLDAMSKLGKRYALELPIVNAVTECVQGTRSAHDMIQTIFERYA